MFSVQLDGRVRRACHIEGLSVREAARRFSIYRTTGRKRLALSVPPGHRRTKPASRPKLDVFTAIIDVILEADPTSPPKQRHTAKRIHGRLRAEHGFTGRLYHREGLCPLTLRRSMFYHIKELQFNARVSGPDPRFASLLLE